MAIKIYDKGSSEKLSKNFKAKEFACTGKTCCTTVKVDEKLVEYLQAIRDHFGKAVRISSGYRCEKRNKAVGGVSGSRHTKGQAADIYIRGVKPTEIAKYAESIGILGIGLYESFVHIDTRTKKSFWYGHEQVYRSTFGGATDNAVAVKIRVLRDGCKGEDVKALQLLLIGNGFTCGSHGADGDFGSGTEVALKNYQKDHGLTPSGVYDEKTMAEMLGL